MRARKPCLGVHQIYIPHDGEAVPPGGFLETAGLERGVERNRDSKLWAAAKLAEPINIGVGGLAGPHGV